MPLLTRSRQRPAARTATRYQRIVVAATPDAHAAQAVSLACQLAADKGAAITILCVVEVPELLPLDARMDAEEQAARAVLLEGQAIADSYGVRVRARLERAREAGAVVVEEARQRDAQLVLIGYASRDRTGGHRIGRTADYVLKHAPTRVMLVRGA